MSTEFVYHGSQYLFDVVKPMQARGMNEPESQLAIYACAYFSEVIPFALPIRWYPDNPGGQRRWSTNYEKVQIEYGSLNPNGVGYVYKIKADDFVQLDANQWICTKEAVPVEVTKIFVKDYFHLVEFSEEARII